MRAVTVVDVSTVWPVELECFRVRDHFRVFACGALKFINISNPSFLLELGYILTNRQTTTSPGLNVLPSMVV